MKKAVFLDRDGVIVKQKHRLTKKENLELILNSDKAIKILNDSGYKVIVVTNQSIVARGLASIEEVNDLNNHMSFLLMNKGAKIDKIYFCPHHPTKGVGEYKKDCECRKPEIGMIFQAKEEYNLNLKKSWLIGDKTSDILAGKKAKCKTILVRTGYGGKDKLFSTKPDYVTRDLLEAAYKILQNGK